MLNLISVVIPVGPHEANTRWLNECLQSVKAQTVAPVEIILVDDEGPSYRSVTRLACYSNDATRIVYPRIRLGVGQAFNFGIAFANTECVLMLGSDDTLEPICIEQCLNAYAIHKEQDAYYALPVKYMNSGQVQFTPCNAAMVTKGFWRMTGGFPIEATTAPDAALLSICLRHQLPVHVVGDKPLYNYRDHDETDTIRHAAWHDVVIQIRHLVTLEWAPRC
jgi:glycosyltransferase involved in cell wall biosynthesis